MEELFGHEEPLEYCEGTIVATPPLAGNDSPLYERGAEERHSKVSYTKLEEPREKKTPPACEAVEKWSEAVAVEYE